MMACYSILPNESTLRKVRKSGSGVKKDKRVEKFEMRFPMMEGLRFDKYYEENIIMFAGLEKDNILDDLDKVT
uniref:40S ribosomal protein S15 n=1 Tax=Strongyloides venezuelensis TaxID=75913 RepID=A0A0K0F4T0_STRVS